MKLVRAFLVASWMFGQTLPVVTGPQRDLWVAFRYDADRVVFYTERLIDPVNQKVDNPLPPPVAPDSGGGYLLPLTPERLATFRPDPEVQGGGERVRLNQKYWLWLDGTNVVEAITEVYAEQWGSENPVVRIAVMARVSHAFKGNYFLISRERKPSPPADANLPQLRTSRKIVGSFEPLGNLAIDKREAGWIVSLLTMTGKRSNVEYSYGGLKNQREMTTPGHAALHIIAHFDPHAGFIMPIATSD